MDKISFGPVMAATTTVSFLAARMLERGFLQTVGIAWTTVIPLYAVVWQCYIFPFYVSEMRYIPTVADFLPWSQFFDIISHEFGEPQRKWHEQYAPIIRYFFPLGAERLSIAEDEALKQMTVKNPYNYPKPVRAKLWMVRILGEGVLLAEGHEHVHQRKALAPGFSIQSIRALTPIFWEKSLLLANCWRKEMRADGVSTKSCEALDWLNRTTLDIIGKAGFVYDVNSLENPDAPLREAYRLCFPFDIVSRILIGLQAFSPIFNHLPSKVNRDLMQSRSIILSKATEIIKEKQEEAANNTGGKDILALIARDNKKLKEAGEAGLSFETMRDQVMTFLGAGHDTTATGVARTLHLLSKHPVVQSRLREEIKDHMPFLLDKSTRFDPDLIGVADADKLPYLDNVCREALRFIPPIPMTVRQSVNDDILGGYKVPVGTVVYVLANAINRLPMYWGDRADEFNPDRWDDLPATANPNAFMTFLQGPRGCIGRKFAETEMKILLCCLLSMYEFQRDFETLDPEDWKMWRLVLRPRDGVTLRVTAI
ncbi:cytochrome p450 monooxygenase protein [Colletotrichum incanum]|uniref:Cytochrome p450 monooxygenase protein n=1 Tax=Colletotrichum incanum TaxID=1573173 RepID=A0A166SF79_COLIC|nr:cytochrome p450 monooxygenase protein [Colletotrichum incanum]OHW97307.1 cytochrome p450 [Colletotrichum incanum]